MTTGIRRTLSVIMPVYNEQAGILLAIDDVRRHVQACEPRAHGRRRLDRAPRQAAMLQRGAELAAARADIEQLADVGHEPAHLRAHTGNVVGGIDRRSIELERIEGGF